MNDEAREEAGTAEAGRRRGNGRGVGDSGGAGEGEETAASFGEGGLIGWEAFFFWWSGWMAIFGLCGFELLMILGDRRVEDGCLCLWVACRFLLQEFCSVQSLPIYFGFF